MGGLLAGNAPPLCGRAGLELIVPTLDFRLAAEFWEIIAHVVPCDSPLRHAKMRGRDDAWADRIAARAASPIYFIDDDTAIRIRDGKLDVVSEGRWRFHP